MSIIRIIDAISNTFFYIRKYLKGINTVPHTKYAHGFIQVVWKLGSKNKCLLVDTCTKLG